MRESLHRFNNWLLEWFDASFGLIVVGLILFIVVSVGWLIYASYRSAISEHIALKKSEWKCMATKPYVTVTYIKSGDVLIPIESRIDECVTYERTY